MIFHYAGAYDGKEEGLPSKDHPEGYRQFKEPENMKVLSIIANGVALVVTFVMMFIVGALARPDSDDIFIGALLALICLVPHEFLHALCFKGDVYMYHYLKKGMMFVVGTEDMSKLRFIMMSLCPNLVLGVLPFLIFLFNHDLAVLGTLGGLAIGMGAGDYMNVYNALVQVPKGAKIYNSGFHSYWYQ